MKWVLSIFLIALFAGCIAEDESPPPADVKLEDAIPFGEGHDHQDPEQHRLSQNATLLDTDNLQRFGVSVDQVVGAHALAIHESTLVVAVNAAGTEGQQGFHVFDVSDPENLVHVSFWDAGTAVSGDRTIAMSHDGQIVFLGFESGARPGIAAVRIADPTNPVEVGFFSDPAGFGPHTLSTGHFGGTQYVFSLSVGVTILSYADGQFVPVGRYITADELAILDGLDPADPAGFQTWAFRSLYAHDMNFYEHEGTPYLLVAYAYDGAKILDLSIPSVPILQARWLPPEVPTENGGVKHYTHSMSAETIDGRFIVVVGSETFEDEINHIASPIWVLDATDAVNGLPLQTAPAHLSTWANPSDAPAGRLGLSVHFFRQLDGMMYLSHYHGGVWGFDLTTHEKRVALDPIGFIMPVPEEPALPFAECCIGWDLSGVPMVFDVEVDANHNVYAADIIQGVSSIRFS